MPLTSIVIFLPLVGAIVALMLRGAKAARWTALITTTVTFFVSLLLYTGFDAAADPSQPQLANLGAWFPDTIDIKYFVGIDGLNLLLVLLTTLLGPIVVLASWTYITDHQKGYYTLLLILQTGVTGVFTAFDLILFYVFFELTLIPMYFSGGPGSVSITSPAATGSLARRVRPLTLTRSSAIQRCTTDRDTRGINAARALSKRSPSCSSPMTKRSLTTAGSGTTRWSF